MAYSERLIKRFQKLYQEKYNQEISVDKSNVEIAKLANLVKVMIKEEIK